ncbi:MAG: hypothetical protein LW806_11490 [Planctomycetaceae bacterium]|nr:hypothetical protein [Planctomycetaceae bacterium]
MAHAQAPADTTAIEAFLAARGWLDRDSLPPLEAPEARIELPGTTAVALLLRADGRVVGRGEDATGDALMVRRAAGRAVAEALGDATIRAVRAELGDRVTSRLSLEIELAGPTRPLLGRTVLEASARVVPGSEGVALLKGDEVFRAFPSRLLANDSADRPDSTITGLMRAAGLPAKELREFGPADRVSLARFDTIRLRQGTATAAPSIVVRGGRVIELAEISPGFVRALAGQLAARLAGQVMPLPQAAGPGASGASGAAAAERWGLLGTYNPTADIHEPAFAGARDEAFAALALACASRAVSLPEPTRAHARTAARRLVDALLARATSERGDAGDAMTLLVLRTIDGDQPHPSEGALSERVRRAADAMLVLLTARPAPPAGGEAEKREPGTAEHSAPGFDGATLETAALVAAALTAPRATPEEHAIAATLVDALLAGTTSARGRLADAMLPLALALHSKRLPEPTRVALDGVLVELATLLDTLQLLPAPAGQANGPGDVGDPLRANLAVADFPPDLVGGFALPGARASKADAQGLRIAAALALLRKSEESGAPLDPRLRASVRFLAQHVADEPWTDGFRRPDALRGLVRASLASDDCPPAATAAGLILAVLSLPAATE